MLIFFWKSLRKFSKNFRIFWKLFVRFVLSKIFPEIGRAETIRLVQKSSNFELSSRFFGRLKTETKRNSQFLYISCFYPGVVRPGFLNSQKTTPTTKKQGPWDSYFRNSWGCQRRLFDKRSWISWNVRWEASFSFFGCFSASGSPGLDFFPEKSLRNLS